MSLKVITYDMKPQIKKIIDDGFKKLKAEQDRRLRQVEENIQQTLMEVKDSIRALTSLVTQASDTDVTPQGQNNHLPQGQEERGGEDIEDSQENLENSLSGLNNPPENNFAPNFAEIQHDDPSLVPAKRRKLEPPCPGRIPEFWTQSTQSTASAGPSTSGSQEATPTAAVNQNQGTERPGVPGESNEPTRLVGAKKRKQFRGMTSVKQNERICKANRICTRSQTTRPERNKPEAGSHKCFSCN